MNAFIACCTNVHSYIVSVVQFAVKCVSYDDGDNIHNCMVCEFGVNVNGARLVTE